VAEMDDSDKPDIGMLVTSIGVILAIIGFILFVIFAVVNPAPNSSSTLIQFQKVYASVGFIILGLVLTTIGVFISKR